MGVGGRQRRDCHELGVGLRAAKVLLLGVVHRGGSARPQVNEISNAGGAERVSKPEEVLNRDAVPPDAFACRGLFVGAPA